MTEFLSKRNDLEAYGRMINEVVERLFNESQKLAKGETIEIDWEYFTTDYIKTELPDSDAERWLWREKRNNYWRVDINKGFIERGYKCRLFSTARNGGYNDGAGVYLKCGNDAVDEEMRWWVEQEINSITNKSDEAETMIPVWPSRRKHLRTYIDMARTVRLTNLIGTVNAVFPKRKAKVMIEKIMGYLPAPEENGEDD